MSDHSEIVAVFDGGGTTTRAALTRFTAEGSWEILGRGSAGPGNPSVVGVMGATAAVVEALRQARIDGGLHDHLVGRAVVALAGTLRDDVRDQMAGALAEKSLAREIRVVPDLLPILYAARSDGQGVGVIAGTGSVAFANDVDGRLNVRGGWGYLLGDEGSGYWLGRAGIRRLIGRLERSLPQDSLDKALLEHLGVANVGGVKRAIYGADDPRQVISSVAPLVVAEELGEPSAAADLLTECAESLAGLVEGLAPSQQSPFTVAASGGLFTGSKILTSRFEQAIAARHPHAKVVLVTDPLEGCLALSRDEEFRRPLLVEDGP